MIVVVAGILECAGRILICQRTPGQSHPLQWEFPGGKVEPGEEPAAALVRELMEELGIQARIGDEILRYPFRYPNRNPIVLIFYRVEEFHPEPRNLVFHDMRWESPARLAAYDFVEGDRDFLLRWSA